MKNGNWLIGMLTFAGIFLGQSTVGLCADLSLEQAIQTALQQNTTIKITQKGEDTAKAALRAARGKQGFSLAATSGFDLDKTAETSTNQTVSLKLTASLSLYSGGKTAAEIQSGKLGVAAAKLSTERECENIR